MTSTASRRSLTASGLFHEITGVRDYESTFCERDESCEDSFYDEDLFDLMFDDLEVQEDEIFREVPKKKTFFIPKLDESGEMCSICFCNFDDVIVELNCHHRFCAGCVAGYLKIKIAEAPKFHHKV
jgi:hypothetical protein